MSTLLGIGSYGAVFKVDDTTAMKICFNNLGTTEGKIQNMAARSTPFVPKNKGTLELKKNDVKRFCVANSVSLWDKNGTSGIARFDSPENIKCEISEGDLFYFQENSSIVTIKYSGEYGTVKETTIPYEHWKMWKFTLLRPKVVYFSDLVKGPALSEYLMTCSLVCAKLALYQCFWFLYSMHTKEPTFRHNDFTPSNVMVELSQKPVFFVDKNILEGIMLRKGQPLIRVIDFGLASAVSATNVTVNRGHFKKKFGVSKFTRPQLDLIRMSRCSHLIISSRSDVKSKGWKKLIKALKHFSSFYINMIQLGDEHFSGNIKNLDAKNFLMHKIFNQIKIKTNIQ